MPVSSTVTAARSCWARRDFAAAEEALTPGIKDDIRFARDRVQDFARRQRDSLHEFRPSCCPAWKSASA